MDTQTFFTSGASYFDQIVEAIRLAQFEISGVFYIFRNDALGQQVLNELKQAQARGVRCRLIVDGVGTFREEAWLRSHLGTALKVYHPVRLGFPNFSRLNQRCHIKLLIIDQQKVFSGSMNVDARHADGWKDIGLITSDSEQIDSSLMLFETLWRGPIRSWRGFSAVIRARGTFFHRRDYYRKLLREVVSVDHAFRAVTAYFVPRRSFIHALIVLAKGRKISTQIVIPQHTDHPFTRWLAQAYIEKLIEGGVRVYSYSKAVLHAKALAFDDEVWVGSTNLNYRSFQHDLELDYLLLDQKARTEFDRFWSELIQDSFEWTMERLKSIPLWERILGKALLRFRYWC